MEKVCKICGVVFETSCNAQRYCEKCRFMTTKKPKSKLKELVCPACGVKFCPHHGQQKYCSEYCRERHNKNNTDGYLNTYNMRSYAVYQQSRLAKCARIAKEAGMTYGEAEKAGLFKDVK